ncbi:hypothetical protein E2C01_091378 [Portunus trituberculatus]|uniref:Uncharacterized protein n=1 Tax=Portunus trituberculatus TaxID=210409 RepID=A0A5B7JP80_PORTR|nr:hypothetical protein [Portunus trituberculatus]
MVHTHVNLWSPAASELQEKSTIGNSHLLALAEAAGARGHTIVLLLQQCGLGAAVLGNSRCTVVKHVS